MTKELHQVLEALMRVPTPTGQEWRLIPFVSQWLRHCGFEVQIQPVPPVDGLTPPGRYWNLIARRGDSPLWVSTHMDTVPAESYAYVFQDGWLWGRGAVDVKGQLAALLLAVANTTEPVSVVLFADEERGGAGSAAFRLPQPAWMVNLEPTNLQVYWKHAGSLEARVSFQGTGGHGSCTDPNGQGAIQKMMALVQALQEELDADPGRLTIYQIAAGSDMLAIPEQASLALDLRIWPGEEVTTWHDWLSQLVRRYDGDMQVVEQAPPVELDIPEWRQWWDELGIPSATDAYPSWTDAVHLIEKGYPTIVLGAGSLQHAHSRQERIAIQDVEQLIEMLIRMFKAADQLPQPIQLMQDVCLSLSD